MATQDVITQDRLKEILDYDPETGVFRWRVSPRPGRIIAGQVSGCIKNTGYRCIQIDNMSYSEHRLAWLYIYGEWPPNQMDHVNTIRNDNRIANLRLASASENCRNRTNINKSGYKGVSWRYNKWRAGIKIKGKSYHLGCFPTLEMAHAAYCEAAKKFFGEFARTK